MHLTIIDNVLTHCTLQAGEHTVVLPAFDCIADDAFADIPEGQLQHLDISAVRAFDLHAFRGLGRLRTLTVCAYDFADRDNFLLGSLLMPEVLCIREADLPDGGKGIFSLSAMIAENFPAHLVTTSGVELCSSISAYDEGTKSSLQGVRELTLYVSGTFRWDAGMANPQMRGIHTLRLVNSRWTDARNPEVVHEIVPAYPQTPIPAGWKPMPCSFDEEVFAQPGAFFLERLILPEGLTAIPDRAFFHTAPLRTLRIPASVERIGRAAFGCCDDLTAVEMGSEAFAHLGPDAFRTCHALKSVAVYGRAEPFPAEDLQRHIAITHALRLAQEFWPASFAEARRMYDDDELLLTRLSFRYRGQPTADTIACLLGAV